MPFALENSTS